MALCNKDLSYLQLNCCMDCTTDNSQMKQLIETWNIQDISTVGKSIAGFNKDKLVIIITTTIATAVIITMRINCISSR